MHRLIHAAVSPLIVMAASGAARALNDDMPLLQTEHGLTFRAWLPPNCDTHRGTVPLILFSHGFGGCAQQSHSLTKALAAAGYIVLAPNHRDEGCDRYTGSVVSILSAGRLHPEKPFTQPQAWTDSTESGRRVDIEALLHYAITHAPYKDAIDVERIAVMGHSLGGYAALGLGGAWSSWYDPRIRCVLALSPYAAPFVAMGTLKDLRVPIMYQTGTRDFGIAPALLRHGGYRQTGGRKYLVVLQGAGHFAWTELNREFQTTIARYAIAFFDRELLGKPAALLDQSKPAQVSDYRHAP